MTDDQENLYVQIHVSRATNEDDQTARLNFALYKVRARARADGAASERAKVVAYLRRQAGEWGGGIGAATLETAADAIERADHDTRPTKGGE
jgi:hypothetical protein